ncbi:MAG: M1 family metallopeptidase [Lutibacter sp.]|uniref:M1 family metallopeptidase n=1 Tax=Lutibacter sp. TaxID=1925666 RepID=UPI00180BB3BE|nr:M1 family metallopeptidase [Lutibacter sp.]MBT8317189.1 M1 family metallopeptidase [Lutibacter sp.]NNJ58048.1 M1 family metallopeptidase [Lutibacter sp.]
MKKIIFVIFLLFVSTQLFSQSKNFTHQDTLRGSITKERIWWDLKHYDLSIKVNPNKKFLSGKNSITYEVLESSQIMQIDLQQPMKISKVIQNEKKLDFKKDGYSYFIKLESKQLEGAINEITIFFKGKPTIAVNPPWDGGLTWEKDSKGIDFIATSCQGDGASLWWPCKDHMYDEPESMAINITVPSHLINVSNGRLKTVTDNNDDTKTYHWYVKNPINNYGVNMNIGDYAHFSEKYNGENGILDCDYYVLKENLEKAKQQFKDVPKMLEAFEHWFGPYPFYEDSYKLVEVPYLGMEHQSSVTYGNQYQNGYLGRDLSNTGWGLKFDFIIIHESGHEWFANNITNKDIADMWIHESFTAYSENLFLDYHFGKLASSEYVIGTRQSIQNDRPIIGKYNVNHAGSGDMYYKGANMLHTLRQLIEDDEKWRQILRGLNAEFYHQTVTTQQIENYLSEKTKINLTAFFNQYLRDTRIPTLEYKINDNQLTYRWIHIVNDFDMPIKVSINSSEKWIFPSKEWKELKVNSSIRGFKIDENFYVESKHLN